MPGHLQNTTEVPLSKAANSRALRRAGDSFRGVTCLVLLHPPRDPETDAAVKKKIKKNMKISQRFYPFISYL